MVLNGRMCSLFGGAFLNSDAKLQQDWLKIMFIFHFVVGGDVFLGMGFNFLGTRIRIGALPRWPGSRGLVRIFLF